MFNTIEINRNNLTIMGVKFSDLKTLESTANALGSNMFEGFKPTPKGIEIIRDYVIGKISLSEARGICQTKSLCLIPTNTLILTTLTQTLNQDY